MHLKTSNDNELIQAMADAILRVGECCTKADLRAWFTTDEISRCGDAAIALTHDMLVQDGRVAA